MAVSDIKVKEYILSHELMAEADLASAQAEAAKSGQPLGKILVGKGLISPQKLQEAESDSKSDDNNASVEKSVHNILEYGVRAGASDIHIEPRGEYTVVRYRIDGILVNNMKLANSLHDRVVDYLKELAGVLSHENRVPATGEFDADFGGIPIVFRLNTLPTTMGEKATIRIIEQASTNYSLQDFGMSDSSTKMVMDVLRSTRGVVIATSSILSDSTLLLYGLLQQFDTETNNILSIENPVMQNLPGINQTEVDVVHGLNFPTAISAALKQDPTTLMVTDMNNGASAELMFDAALNGRLILGGLHAENSTLAIIRLNDMGVQPFLIASALRLVIATRRVRKLCPVCRKPYTPSGDELRQIREHLGEWEPNQNLPAMSNFGDSHAGNVHTKKIIPAPSRDELAKENILQRIAEDPNIVYRGIKDTATKPTTANAESPAQKNDQAQDNQNPTFFQAVGCEKCNGTGYQGQLNLFEILLITDELASAIGAGKTERELHKIATKDGFVPLARDGLDKAAKGLTSISEVLRVL